MTDREALLRILEAWTDWGSHAIGHHEFAARVAEALEAVDDLDRPPAANDDDAETKKAPQP